MVSIVDNDESARRRFPQSIPEFENSFISAKRCVAVGIVSGPGGGPGRRGQRSDPMTALCSGEGHAFQH